MAHLEPSSEVVSERAPLLAEHNVSTVSENDQEVNIINNIDEDAPEPWTTRSKIWYSVLGITGLAIFIVAIVSAKRSKELEV